MHVGLSLVVCQITCRARPLLGPLLGSEPDPDLRDALSVPCALTWLHHAHAQHLEGVAGEPLDLSAQSTPPVHGEPPQAGLALALAAHQLRRLLKAVAEAQVVADRVLPAVGSRAEEGKALSVEKLGKTELTKWRKQNAIGPLHLLYQ